MVVVAYGDLAAEILDTPRLAVLAYMARYCLNGVVPHRFNAWKRVILKPVLR